MRTPRWLALAAVTPFLLAGCSDARAQVTIQADVTVCRSADECEILPAAGARVRVETPSGVVVVDDALTADGTLATEIDAGDYTVTASLMRMGDASFDVTVTEGEEVEVMLNLPRLLASSEAESGPPD